MTVGRAATTCVPGATESGKVALNDAGTAMLPHLLVPALDAGPAAAGTAGSSAATAARPATATTARNAETDRIKGIPGKRKDNGPGRRYRRVSIAYNDRRPAR